MTGKQAASPSPPRHTTMNDLAVAMVQPSLSQDLTSNQQRLEESIRQAAAGGAQLIVLPELHNTPYFCQTEDVDCFNLAENIPGPSTQRFGQLARELGVVLVLSLFEQRAPGLCHNTAVVVERDGTIAGIHRKMHIPDDPGYYEKFYFTPGDLGFHPIPTSVGRLGVQVCWDQWFPEGARLMALQGADLLLFPTAIGYEPTDPPAEQARQRDAWITIQRSHAIANALPVVAVNRTGFEQSPATHASPDEGIRFWGSSFAAGAQGEWLAQMGEQEEGVRIVHIDLRRTEQVRRWWPFLRDRRTDAYQGLTKRWIGTEDLH